MYVCLWHCAQKLACIFTCRYDIQRYLSLNNTYNEISKPENQSLCAEITLHDQQKVPLLLNEGVRVFVNISAYLGLLISLLQYL